MTNSAAVVLAHAAAVVADEPAPLVERDPGQRHAAVADRAQDEAALDDLLAAGGHGPHAAVVVRHELVDPDAHAANGAVDSVAEDLERGAQEAQLHPVGAPGGLASGVVAGELLAKLRSAPEGRTGEEETTSRRQVVLALVATLTPLAEQIRQLDLQIAAAVKAHPDGEIFLSLFKGTVLTAAEFVAEIGDCRARYPTR